MIKKIDGGYYYEYRSNGKRHQVNGPALVFVTGEKYWFLYDQWHRYYGYQSNKNQWWLHGEKIK